MWMTQLRTSNYDQFCQLLLQFIFHSVELVDTLIPALCTASKHYWLSCCLAALLSHSSHRAACTAPTNKFFLSSGRVKHQS